MKPRPPCNQMRCRAALAVLSLLSPTVNARAASAWTGAGLNNSWTEGDNWFRLPPGEGDDLTFPAGAARLSNNNNFAAGTGFNLVTFSGAGYSVAGNQVSLTAGINVTHGAGNTLVSLPLALAGNQTFTVTQSGASLYLYGTVSLGTRILTIDGAGQTVLAGNATGNLVLGKITKTGAGTLWVTGTPSYNGSTTVNGGILKVDGTLTNSRVTANSGGTLRGAGAVNGILANTAGTVNPGGTSPGILESSADVTLGAGSVFNVRLNGATLGTQYDQLKVTGAVTLGGTLQLAAGFNAPVGTVFTLIDNDGSDQISGTFAGLPEGAEFMVNGRPFRISYGSRFIGGAGGRDNDVTIEAIPVLRVWDGGGGLNNLWSTPQNWVNDTLPEPGDDLEFSGNSPGQLTATNDFAPGRRVGKIRISDRWVTLQGNPISIERGIFCASDYQLTVKLPLTLGASQIIEATAASVYLESEIDVGSYTLTINAAMVHPDAELIHYGRLFGAGKFIKEGPQEIEMRGPVQCTAGISVNAGGLVTGDVTGPVRVYGGALTGAGMGSLEVFGGTVYGGHVAGSARFYPGSGYSAVRAPGAGPGFEHVLTVDGSLDLGGCSLSFGIFYSDPPEPGNTQTLLVSAAPITGTFAGYPEGARFINGGRTYGLTYHGGVSGNSVAVTNNPPFVWDGLGSGVLWTTPGNWNPDTAPLGENLLVFPDGVSKRIITNDYPAGTVFHSLTFQRNSYIIGGNELTLTEGINNAVSSGLTVILAPLTFPGDPNPFNEDVPIVVGNASELQLGGVVTGEITKSGSGILTLSGSSPNSLRGTILEGRMDLKKTGGAAAVGNIIIGNGLLTPVLGLGDDHQIEDDAFVSVNEGARFELAGNVETVRGVGGKGEINLGAAPVTRGSLTVTSSATFAGRITGAGSFNRTGNGTFELTGNTSFTGPARFTGGYTDLTGTFNCSSVSVTGGEVWVNGTLTTPGPVVVQGGTIRGRGRMPALTMTAGVLAPGTFTGGFDIKLGTGSVSLDAATSFRALLTGTDPGFEVQKLSVTGSVSLNNASLVLARLSGPLPALGTTLVIVENDGSDSVSGTFSGLPQGAIFDQIGLRWQISYTAGGNDVAITLLDLLPPEFHSFAVTPGTGVFPDREVIRITGQAIPGLAHEMQYTTDLINWTTWPADITYPLTGLIDFHMTSPPGIHRFCFRVRRK